MRLLCALAVIALPIGPAIAAGATGVNCGAGVDARFVEAAAFCGVSRTVASPAPAIAVTETASVPFALRRVEAPRRNRNVARSGAHGTLVNAVARSYRVDPGLLAAMVRAESGGRPDAVSNKGALGLMQVMPGTARGLGVRDPKALLTSPTLALSTGALYLKTLQARFGNNVPLVVAAYNAGPGAVQKAGRRVPAYRETRGYVATVMRGYAASRGGR